MADFKQQSVGPKARAGRKQHQCDAAGDPVITMHYGNGNQRAKRLKQITSSTHPYGDVPS
jgi:hypothetical protein